MSPLGRPRPHHLELEVLREDNRARTGVADEEWNTYVFLDPLRRGNHTESDILWTRNVKAQLAATAEAAEASAALDALAAEMARFLGGARWQELTAPAIEARRAGHPVTVTMRSRAQELSCLPWELVQLDGTPLCDLDDCLLRFDCLPEERSPAAASSSPTPVRAAPRPRPSPGGRVLFAWSGGVPAAEHQRALLETAGRDGLTFVPERDVVAHATLPSLRAALAAAAPPVVVLHLLCHGEPLGDGAAHGLVLGGAAPISPTQLAESLAPHAATLRLVVLSACIAGNPGAIDNPQASVAEALRRAGVPAVIASRLPLSTRGSTALTEALYRALFLELTSLETAFLAARRAVRARPAAPDELPHRDGAALQLHLDSTLGLAYHPWIVRPYRGLDPYRPGDGLLLCGRDEERRALRRLVAAALERPDAPRCLVLAGASGTGKSSLAHAGLVDDLCAGRLRDAAPRPDAPTRWSTLTMTPLVGRDPTLHLDALLAARAPARTASVRSPDDRPMLALVIDQLEELFAPSLAPPRREAFLRRLWQLAQPGGEVFVILVVRIDCLDRFGHLHDVDRVSFDHKLLAGERCYLVREPSPAHHERLIAEPAAAAGVLLEEGLCEMLCHELRGQPGALPTLSYVLDQLWERRAWKKRGSATDPGTGWHLTVEAYQQLGGLSGAITNAADRLLAALPHAQREQLRGTLVKLVHGHEDPQLATRRRGLRLAMRPDEGDAGGDAARAYDAALDAMIEARLLVQGDSAALGEPPAPWLELASDALVRAWPQLRAWYQEARPWLAITDELRRLAATWRAAAVADASGRHTAAEGYLLGGERLRREREAWAQHRHHLGAGERQAIEELFLACERGERDRNQRARHDKTRARIDSVRKLVSSSGGVLGTVLRYKLRLLLFVLALLALFAIALVAVGERAADREATAAPPAPAPAPAARDTAPPTAPDP